MTYFIIILALLLLLSIAFAIHLDIEWAKALSVSRYLADTNHKLCKDLALAKNKMEALESVIREAHSIAIDIQKHQAIKEARIITQSLAFIARRENEAAKLARKKIIDDISNGKQV